MNFVLWLRTRWTRKIDTLAPPPTPTRRSWMHPISQDRVAWITARLQVLDACVKDLTRRQAAYLQSLSVTTEQLNAAMRDIKIEQLRLSVELSVLNYDLH